MMDGTPDTWVGYHRWHAFMRAAAILGSDAARWLHLNRSMALAWAIQTEADPDRSSPNNPGLPAARLAALRAAWMGLVPEQLDWAFVNHRFRAPAPEALQSVASRKTYARVQQLLSDAAGTLQPFHDGHGRFWELSHADFMALPGIYGEQLIASPGPEQGARSALVKVLRGTLDGFPQMPLNRPPMNDGDIQYIQDWIDAGCPSG